MILPIMEAYTTCINPARRAKMAIINSIAFPKVAEKRPLTVGFDCNDISLVVYPMIRARGTIAKIHVTNVNVSFLMTNAEKILSGIKRRK